MGLLDELNAKVDEYVRGVYQSFQPRDVPQADELVLGSGQAATFDGCMMFIDVRQSSTITEAFRLMTAAKMIRSYTYGAVRIVHANHGKVVSFNGDGMLAAFMGDRRAEYAVTATLQCRWFVEAVLRRKFAQFFARNAAATALVRDFRVGVGIDDGAIYAVRVGISATNDIAWVGRPTNTAAKLSSRGTSRVFVTSEAFRGLPTSLRRGPLAPAWTAYSTTAVAGTYRRVTSTTARRAIR